MDLLSTAIPIARGASGEVYQVYDPRLQRKVALKLLRHGDPESIRRMLREARAQARVDHPNVCKVYEVGERDGRPYIVMQLVEGQTLDEAVDGLPLDRKVELMATVAEAIQAAHAVGLVHRDLKPANILVEERDGALRPIVVDFGIAREMNSESMTMTGELLGTPAYMSPEQVRGDLEALDRRSDVFSLAVLLYEIVAGVHPFAAKSTVETMVGITRRDPPLLRRIAPRLPQDLVAVIEKALEKSPERRYQSAALLALDLRNYLAGRPVTARPSTLFNRTERRIRRNPLLAAVFAATLVLIAIAAIVVLRVQAEAAQRARLAQRFGITVERAENLLRMAHLSPEHDITEERRLVEQELARIEDAMRDIGKVAVGPGSYALGRGALVLSRPESAVRHLQRALDAGFSGPAVQLAFAAAQLDTLDAAIRDAERILDVESRQETRRAAVARHGALARAAMERARSADFDTSQDVSPRASAEETLLAARLALAEGNWAEARSAGVRSAARLPWFYDGLLVAAEADLRTAGEALEAGDEKAAEEPIRRALDLLDSAGQRAPSDPAVFLAQCRAWRSEMGRRWGNEQAEDAHERALEKCDVALRILPDDPATLSARTLTAWRFGRWLLGRGRDPEPALQTAISSIEALASRLPAEAEVHLGNIALTRAEWARDQGEMEDARALLRDAIARFESAATQEPTNPYLYVNLGRAWMRLADYDWSGDWDAALANAIQVARTGIATASGSIADLHHISCQTHAEWAYHARHLGRDPGDHAVQAVHQCERALALRPSSAAIRNSLAMALWTDADLAMARGEDARGALEAASDAFDATLQAGPEYFAADVNRASVLLDLATQRLQFGGDIDELIRQAEEHAANIREVYPLDFAYHQTRIAFVRARAAARSGNSAEAARWFDTAQEQGSLLVGRWPSPPTNAVLAARVERTAAQWWLDRNEPDVARRHALAAIELLDQVLEQSQDLAAAWAEVALTADILRRADTPRSDGWRSRAIDAARRRLEIDPWTAPEISRLASLDGVSRAASGQP
ncbi:MAG: serine/threonine protein kinase [Acidobacteria bacterium]|nr:MAG: serine/threonine protein kinase [Acidobacteriota bacterium]